MDRIRTRERGNHDRWLRYGTVIYHPQPKNSPLPEFFCLFPCAKKNINLIPRPPPLNLTFRYFYFFILSPYITSPILSISLFYPPSSLSFVSRLLKVQFNSIPSFGSLLPQFYCRFSFLVKSHPPGTLPSH